MNEQLVAEGLRWFNLVAFALLAIDVGLAILFYWKKLDPIERLFAMSLLAMIFYICVVAFYGIKMESPYRWYTTVATVSSIWMLVTVTMLTRRYRHPVLPAAPAPASEGQGWHDEPDYTSTSREEETP